MTIIIIYSIMLKWIFLKVENKSSNVAIASFFYNLVFFHMIMVMLDEIFMSMWEKIFWLTT